MRRLSTIFAFFLLAACGQKGFLYLPEKEETSMTLSGSKNIPLVTGQYEQEQ